MPRNRAVEEMVRALVLEGFDHEFGAPAVKGARDPVWQAVSGTGTRLWLDTGDIGVAAGLWNGEFEALTTNNTLLNREVQKGIYDDLIGKAAREIRGASPGIDTRSLLLEIAFVLNAYHALRLVETFDAKVSVELHTGLAHDVDATIAYGKRFYSICPERFIVKVPLTPAGYLGARKLGKLKIPVNFTLGFSARQNYVAALLSRPSYVNIFMGRLNAFVADNGLGSGDNVGEKVTVSTQRELLDLRVESLSRTALIGASMREGNQVSDLAGLDVFTMPPAVAAAYHKRPDPEVSSRVGEYQNVSFAEGVSVDDFNGATLWDVPVQFKTCVADLLKKDVDSMVPDDLQSHFEEAGFGGFLPRWSDTDFAGVAADGKIPGYERWKDRLSSGRVGMDALMTLSGLLSFTADQKALDDRVASLL
ncbi:transaldolase family protein [Planctomycetota bacterium]